ncbi:hypothetical protein Bca4012_064731 [Brassica carinata]|uniref:Uncharacterized protein n=1 Tax=Brassica carinata TaxID=52824 RepID=A0A8X7VM74_BRACI|nr:hypothetical protein Bca52824_017221 [Brassica carinata]
MFVSDASLPSEFFDYFKESGFSCFKGGPRTIQNLRKRFRLSLTEEASLCFMFVEVTFPYDPLLEKRKKAKASNFSSLKKSLTANQSRPEKQQGNYSSGYQSCSKRVGGDEVSGRRSAMVILAATIFSSSFVPASANAGVVDDYHEKSKADKADELNDKKSLGTSGANFARALTLQFGSCKFPENFPRCQDLVKQKRLSCSSLFNMRGPFISEDLELECKGKDKYGTGEHVLFVILSILIRTQQYIYIYIILFF